MGWVVSVCCSWQIGVNNTELWNNLALCCFYASQYASFASLD